MQVVVHRPTTTGAWLWIQAELVERDFALAVHDASDAVVTCWRGDDTSVPPSAAARPPASRWQPEEHEPDHLLTNVTRGSSDTRLWWASLVGLQAGCEYTVRYVPRQPHDGPAPSVLAPAAACGSIPVATFRTLPASLRGRPLRVLLASCYCEDRDVDTSAAATRWRKLAVAAEPPRWSWPLLSVARRVRRARVAGRSLARTGPLAADPESPAGAVARAVEAFRTSEPSPDLTFLVGDQVYLDAPIGDFTRSMSSARMKRHISRTYSRSWEKLAPLLAQGGNYFLSDDHEYWNNYPANPLAWPALLPREARRRWELHARDFMFAIQAPAPLLTFDIGAPREVAFCLVDTRMHRDAPEHPWSATRDFMREPDFDDLLTWIGDLDVPGVLVLGQPLVAAPGGRLGVWRRMKDRGLPDYDHQYSRLCTALAAARHDVLILSGDIHYGRYARIDLIGPRKNARTVHELIASPLVLLPGAGGSWNAKRLKTTSFPPRGRTPLGTVTFTNPLEGTGCPAWRPPWWCPWRKEPCHDHFMTVAFSLEPANAVRVDVTVHLVRPEQSPPGTPTPLEHIVLN